MELYRPMSAEEYKAVAAKEFRGFPPRTEEQPLFAALLSQTGAERIAKHMRIEKRAEHTAYVVSFLVEDSFIRQFPVQHDDEPDYRAVWIPAEDVELLNQHLIGKIRMLERFTVDRADGDVFFA